MAFWNVKPSNWRWQEMARIGRSSGWIERIFKPLDEAAVTICRRAGCAMR
jgi:hypothetical protein